MINENRIVSSTKIDLIDLYGVILKASGKSVIKLDAEITPGYFVQNTTDKTVLASEPVVSLNFGSSATGGTVYFVAAYDYVGFSIDGAKAEPSGDTVEADGRTLYSATLLEGSITITKIGI